LCLSLASSLAAPYGGLIAAAAWLLLRQLLVGLAVAVSAFVAGDTLIGLLGRRGLLGRLGWPGSPRATATAGEPRPAPAGALETAAVATALGLVVLAEAGWLLGAAGLLRPLPVALVLLGIHGAGIAAWRRLGDALRGLARWLGDPGKRRRRLLLLAAGMAGLLPVALLNVYPPVAFDETLYHLPLARAFAASGSLPLVAFLRLPVFPQLQETLFAIVLLFAGDVATHVVSLVAVLLTLPLLVAWGLRLSPGAGWIAAAAYAGTPLVVYLAGTAYVEPGLVLFVTAALYAVDRWRQGVGGRDVERETGGEGDGWLTLAALFAGAAAASKYLGLFFLGIVALAALAAKPDARPASRWRRLARVIMVAAVVMAPWYGRIVAVTGNPVFPFLPAVFGSSQWDPTGYEPEVLRHRLRELPMTLVRLPWDAVFARRRLGGLPPFSPVFLLALPALLAGALTDRRVRALLLVAAAFALPIAALLPDARYLSAGLPLVCLAVGESLAAPLAAWARRRRDERWLTSTAAMVALAICLPGWLYAGYRLYRQGPVPVTAEGRDAWLQRSLPAYPAIRHLNRACGSTYTLYAIHAENLAYFASGRFLGDWSGPGAYAKVLPSNGDARLLYQRLRSLGVDHLLTLENDRALPPIVAPELGTLFQPIYADGRARLFALRGAGGCGTREPVLSPAIPPLPLGPPD
jgi:4-amino-4-deoxy-L-arabinose transferase-like glycosyltransferase